MSELDRRRHEPPGLQFIVLVDEKFSKKIHDLTRTSQTGREGQSHGSPNGARKVVAPSVEGGVRGSEGRQRITRRTSGAPMSSRGECQMPNGRR